jgi:hypothetical protein
MNINSLYLGEVDIRHGTEGLEPIVTNGPTDISEYSRFKFGDGEVSQRYGMLLSGLVLQDTVELLADGDIYVASSAFKVAPPASESLVSPFMGSAERTVASATDSSVLRRFKISKARMATNNYDGMSFDERSRALQDDLVLPKGLNLEGQRVVILDDIRVTGLRQAALERLFEGVGVEHASFYYVLDVPGGKEYPQTEALINIRSVKSIDDVLNLALKPGFIPNIRLCKFILSQDDRERFFALAPQEVVDTIHHYIKADDLENVIKAIP